MNGVEILSTEVIYKTEGFVWLIPLFAGIGFLICLIVAIINWVDFGFDKDLIGVAIYGAVIGAYLGFFGFLILKHETDTVDYIEYKVIIDDSVSMNEFLDKYEILGQEGKYIQ